MKRWVALTALVVVGLTSASCTRRPSQAVGRLNVDGRAQVDTADSGRHTVTGARTLRNGEQVTMLDGTATLSLGSGRQLELRKGTVVRLALQPGTTGQSEPRGELVSGDVLVLAQNEEATVVAGDTIVRVATGAARVSRGLAVVVAVYQGAAGVETAGSGASVPALRQITVPAPGLPSRVTPLTYSPSDSWDQRYLGDAIDLGDQLAARSRGFSAQVSPADGTSADFFRRILPGLGEQPFDASLLPPDRAPGETLVGAAITLQGTRGDFRNRWDSVFAFHDEGAPWGLVALAQGVSREPLLAAVDAAVGRLPGGATQAVAAAGPATPAQTPTPSPTPSNSPPVTVPAAPTPQPGAGSTGGTSASGATGGGQGGGTGPTGATPPTTAPTGPAPASQPPTTRGPVDLGIPLVDNTLNAVVDALSGLLRSLSLPG
jgi:hypothetical protein